MRIRHNLYLDVDVSDALAAMASRPGASKSAIVADALKAWMSSRAARQLGDDLRTRFDSIDRELHQNERDLGALLEGLSLFRKRFDRVDRELRQNERDLGVLLESLSLFIRHQLTVAPSVPDDPATSAIGHDRFEAFIAQVGRQLALGSQSLSRGRPVEADR